MRTATGSRGAWWGRVDPLTCVVGAVALVVYWMHGFDGFLSRDLAIYSYGGQRLADGVPPYLGILNRAGPLAHALPAIGVVGARLAGFDELLGMRLLFLVISVCCVCLVYVLGRDLFSSRLAGLTTSAAFLAFGGFIEYASNGPREKTAMVLFLLCTLWAIRHQRWLAAGFSLGLATLVLQIAFLPGLAAMVVALFALRPGQLIGALFRFALGGLIPAAIALTYFAAVGALRESIDAFLLINAGYSLANSFISDPTQSWQSMRRGFGVSVWLVVVGIAGLIVITVATIHRTGWRRNPPVVPVAAFGVAGIVAVVWTFRDFDSWPDSFLVLPFAAIGIGGLTKLIIERVARRAAAALTLVWLILAVAVAVDFSVTQQDHRLTLQRRSVAAVLDQLPSGAPFLSINAPQALVLSGKTNPTRFQTFSSGLDRYVDDTFPGGLEGFGQSIGRDEPTVITLYGKVRPWFAEPISSEYRRVGTAPGWTWYVHRSVGRETLSALQARLARVR